MAEDRERVKAGQDDPEVEAHRTKAYAEESEAPESEIDRRESDEPDVEAHRFKSG